MGYGRKNHVSLNILDYNLGILGEPKIGKTTLVKEICEKLVGDQGYTFIETAIVPWHIQIPNLMYCSDSFGRKLDD